MADETRYDPPGETLLVSNHEEEQLLWWRGMVLLPVGSRIELIEPRKDAIVTRHRIWGSPGPNQTLILQVDLVEPMAPHPLDPGEPYE